ncbi:MAG TPA: alginate export family protein, partial [Verrucomicrobiae bacterium]|nr:alginate export family protein [Verrucomicrobiae bacterium]
GALVAFAVPAFGQSRAFSDAGTAQPPSPSTPAEVKNPPVTAPFTNAVSSLLEKRIPDALAQGKLNVDARLRYEQADEDRIPAIVKNSYAPTLRTRLGYTTAPVCGLQGMLEAVNVTAFGQQKNYNAAGANGEPERPVVADAPMTRIDQAWLGYAFTNVFTAKIGEQRIVLDNHRFIGDSGWRQNMQTFEAASASSQPIQGLNLYYSYLWKVHRPFGNVSGLPDASTDFDSSSHLINISYSDWKYGRFAGYAYLLNLSNAAGDANSCATYGGYFAGNAPLTEKVAADYRAEFAYQTGWGDSLLRYQATYWNLESGVLIKPFAAGAGCENLGSGANDGLGGGRASFRTPLATLHSFNGWDDVFLNTPANGLRDIYTYLRATLPGRVPLKLVYHKFDADFGGGNYGEEFDATATKQLGRHWKALVKYAYYHGAGAVGAALPAGADIQKFWAQIEFNF